MIPNGNFYRECADFSCLGAGLPWLCRFPMHHGILGATAMRSAPCNRVRWCSPGLSIGHRRYFKKFVQTFYVAISAPKKNTRSAVRLSWLVGRKVEAAPPGKLRLGRGRGGQKMAEKRGVRPYVGDCVSPHAGRSHRAALKTLFGGAYF